MDFSYAYDNVGNITSETREGVTTTYAYDSLGQLTRVNDPHEKRNVGCTITTWAGTSPARCGTRTPWARWAPRWKRSLQLYGQQLEGQADGVQRTSYYPYDAIGNPLNDGTWTYSWEAGRRLAQMSKSGTTVQYQYDANGLRVGKIVNGTETTYTLHGKLLTHLKQGAKRDALLL